MCDVELSNLFHKNNSVSNSVIFISVQAEIFFSAPTFLEDFDLKFHMPGHFYLYDVANAYPLGPFSNIQNCNVTSTSTSVKEPQVYCDEGFQDPSQSYKIVRHPAYVEVPSFKVG